MRRSDWQSALTEYLVGMQATYLRTGFVWGSFDCIHYIGDWIKAVTDVDVIAPYRNAYTTKDGAFELLARTHGTLELALIATLGDGVHPSKAARGDIAYRRSDDACGIFFTSGARKVALFLGGDGLFSQWPARKVDIAFKVN